MPMTDREEMEYSLQRGTEILADHPELFGKAWEEVLNELDDGTPAMLQDRWGAAARVVIATITDYDVKSLIPNMAEYKDRGFICEYVGYLLLTEHDVNLEELLLEAERQGMFDKIAPFVSSNLQYENEFYDGLLCDFFAMLNRHADSHSFLTLIENYSKHIVNLGAQHAAVELLGDLAGKAELAFMHAIARPWYENNREQAGETVGKLLAYPGIWSRKAGLDFLEVSLRERETDFLHYYPQVERLIQADRELWLAAIPVLTRYILDYDCTNKNEETYKAALTLLQSIPDGSLDERRSFLLALQWKETDKALIEAIFQAVICRPFDKDLTVLDVLDTYLYRKIQSQQEDWNKTLRTMFAAFSASGFSADFTRFFDGLPSVTYHLAQQASSQVTASALNYMLTGGIDRLFFGLGLLIRAGSLPNLFQAREALPQDFPKHLTTEQFIYVMKGFLYYTFDSDTVCRTAFQLLLFLEETEEGSVQFCLDEVFAHYPGTMYAIAEQFKKNGTALQIRMAEQVACAYRQSSEACAASWKIKDLAPSQEHLRIFRQAQAKLMQQAKENSKPSFFLELFPSHVLKYGARFGWVVHGKNGQLFYQISPPAHISHQMELSAEYVNDPVQFEIKRSAYLKEVRSRAAGDQGLSATAEGKG
ncbi:MAG: hypothetical protein ACI3W5_09865 [Faecousia sp.]